MTPLIQVPMKQEITDWLNSNDKLMMQWVNIYFGIGVMALICTRFRKMKYGFDVILIRFFYHKDIIPMRWFRYHLIFLYYVGFEIYMGMREFGLIEQIRFHELEQKRDIFFVSGPLGLLFMGLIFQYFFSKEDRYKVAFDWWIRKTSK